MGKIKWISFFWILIGWAIFSWSGELWAVQSDQIEKDLTQKKKDLKDIKKELSLTKEKEKKIEGKEFSVLESLHGIETEVSKREKELREIRPIKTNKGKASSDEKPHH